MRVYSPRQIEKFNVDVVIGMLRVSREELEEKIHIDYGYKNVDILMCYELLTGEKYK